VDFYAVLGIPPDADDDRIRSAYRILVRRYHSDRGAGSSTEKFRQVVEAYETLSDSGRRRAYDRSLAPQRGPVIMSNPFDPRRTQVYPFDRPPSASPFRSVHHYDEIFDELMSSLEDDLFLDSFFSRW
jgi:curved DNA-binding protein CbpA